MREWYFLECLECKNRYYSTSKGAKSQKKIEVKKFCPECRKHTMHKEKKRK